MTVIARCKTCGFESIIREGETITNACGCPLRADWLGWEFVEMVQAATLRGAVDALQNLGDPAWARGAGGASMAEYARRELRAIGIEPREGQ